MMITADFDKFHRENPDVYGLFKHFAYEALSAGAKKISARFICEGIGYYDLKGKGATESNQKSKRVNLTT